MIVRLCGCAVVRLQVLKLGNGASEQPSIRHNPNNRNNLHNTQSSCTRVCVRRDAARALDAIDSLWRLWGLLGLWRLLGTGSGHR